MLFDKIDLKNLPHVEVGRKIGPHITQMTSGTLDIFFDCLSKRDYLSPKGLAQRWLYAICPNEMKELSPGPNDTIDILQSKHSVRKQLIYEVGKLFLETSKNPTLLQTIFTRSRVRKLLLGNMHPRNQDKILALESMTSLEKWKTLVTVLGNFQILEDERELLELPYFYLDSDGKEGAILKISNEFDAHGVNIHPQRGWL